MKSFAILTLFPEMVEAGLDYSIMKRARERELLHVLVSDIRNYTKDKNRRVDDYPYGGGAGMVLQAEPVVDCVEDVKRSMPENTKVIYLTPQGRPFTQETAERWMKEADGFIFLCGHYEGIDERALEMVVTEEASAGDFVLTGGELPALMMVDCMSRLVEGVLKNSASAEDESFSNGLLEYPQYTRPEEFRGLCVPPVLLSGHHGKIAEWRREESLRRTKQKRPDLLRNAPLTAKDKLFLRKLEEEQIQEK